MKQTMLKALVLLAVISLLFALPALAEAAEVTRSVSSTQELIDALKEADQMARDAVAQGKVMDWMNILITNDITITQDISIAWNNDPAQYTRLRIKSDSTQQRKLFCAAPTLFLYTNAFSQVELSNLIFDGNNIAPCMMMVQSSDVTMDNCVVENFKTGTPLLSIIWGAKRNGDQYPQTNLTLRNSVIRNNTCTGYAGPVVKQGTKGTMIVENCTFTGNSSDYVRGTIQASGTLSVSNSTFTANTSIGGSAIFFGIGDISISNCDFLNNVARHEVLDRKEGGGALHIQQCNATIKGCNFIGNTTDSSAGAINIMANSTVDIADCVFRNNVAAFHAGAISVCDAFSKDDTKASHLTLTNCLLENNTANGVDQSGQHKSDPSAPGGGALYLHEYCTATLNRGTIIRNNYTADCGGAVYISFGGRLTVNGAEIYDNKAALDGGGVYVDGAAAYAGYDHAEPNVPAPDDGFATGGKLFFKDGIITKNTANRNGGGVYIGGENEVFAEGKQHIFTGGEMQMTGGVLTANTALDMGGGVYVGACDTGDKGGILEMTGGAIYLNVAGEDGNTSDGADDAGADVYSEGGNAFITLANAKTITAYLRNAKNTFVPAADRNITFTDWFDDYSDQDPTYGKQSAGAIANTGRYKSSVDPHRVVYTPRTLDAAYKALILDYNRVQEVPATGDASMPMLWLGLAILSAMLLKRKAA